ncbi:MAG: hypothetical protein HKN24_05200 [Acidimicrobiales bacterium]|nr:hypothetical protein [Acidimicrobiales bacterium]
MQGLNAAVSAVVAAAIVAVAYLVFGVATAGQPQHEIELQLAEERVSWPWHSSIQRASAAWINSPEGQQWAGDASVEALAPSNLETLTILATGSSAEAALIAARATADGFLAHDLALQLEPFETDVEALETVVEELEARFAEQELAVGTATDDALIAGRSTLLEGTAALLGRIEGDRDRAIEARDAVQARYSITDSQAVDHLRSRVGETIRLFAATLILGWVLQILWTSGSKQAATLVD